MGKNLTAKTSSVDFQVTTHETPLLSQQVVTNKGIPSTLPTYRSEERRVGKECQ